MVLAACLLLGLCVPAAQASPSVSWHETDVNLPADLFGRQVDLDEENTTHADTDLVRVSIVLDTKPTIQMGYATQAIGQNVSAMAYRAQLRAEQEALSKRISTQVLDGQALDVQWNMTLVGNIISANVPFGKLEEIGAMDGVQTVVLEQSYEVPVEEAETAPTSYISGGMTGATTAWAQGYTGAGSRIAVIDTGTDTDHQSFDAGAFQYALQQNAEAAGMSYAEYVAALDLLDEKEIASVLKELNAYERTPSLTASQLYRNLKLAYGYNYVDKNLEITHDYDSQGGHGSHVAGIAAANRYLPGENGAYVPARDTVHVSGVAPDAQLITMKVFGQNTIHESDYMAAIEDAILLGCDAVNLSLGSTNPGHAYSKVYADLLDYLTTTDTVVSIAASNSGAWAAHAYNGGYLYHDDVGFDTVGAPGSYTNSFTVASVDNATSIGPYLMVDKTKVVYSETTASKAKRMNTLDTTGSGTAYPYILIDGVGKAEDYAGMDLTGKVVFCARGETAFYEKANVAAGLGAVAVVIYNNEPGSIQMDLSSYGYSAPCVSILRSEAAAIRNASTAATSGDTTYYTGTVTICSKVDVGSITSEYCTMSSFSSWGVPGTLTLKPEITAPGGNILSVDGETSRTDQYMFMSGTSMATPQVAGLAALMSQYIRENGLDKKTGQSVRALSQSLLMSTAKPLMEEASGSYYSLLTQGAGLAQVDDAMRTPTYVMVDGQSDGKVKAELGDDPEREGVYTFDFTLNNLTNEALDYALRADLFTQDVFTDQDISYLDTATRNLDVRTSFQANGAALVPAETLAGLDLNGDGQTNAADADYLLEYLLGHVQTLADDADVNGDGQVNTYDAHLLLALLDQQTCVTVPANGSVQVSVTLTLPQQVKNYLNLATPNGAYIEAFVHATPVTDQKDAVAHSIPVLAFYGNWSDPSMYDAYSYEDQLSGTDDRVPYLNEPTNLFTLNYGGKDGEFLFGGNPVAEEEAYLPQRNAFNGTGRDRFYRLGFTQIRNAGNSMFLLRNRQTQEVYIQEELGSITGTFYNTNAGYWEDTQMVLDLNWGGEDANGYPLPEGTQVELSLVSAPEYYRNPDGTYDWSALGNGAYLTAAFTIDNTAPTVSDVNLDTESGQRLKVTASDNQYVAAVALLNAAGTKVLSVQAPNQTEAGKGVELELPVSGISGNRFLLAVYDYARNVTTYELQLELGEQIPRPYFTAVNRATKYDGEFLSWVGFQPDSTAEIRLGEILTDTPRAAVYVDGYTFAVTDSNQLLVASDEDLVGFQKLSVLSSEDYPVDDFRGLAYNWADKTLYGLYYSNANHMAFPYLCTIDMLQGTMNVLGTLGADISTIAIDRDGTFYGTGYGSGDLYTYTAQTYTQPTLVGSMGTYPSRTLSTLLWDAISGKLYWAYCADGKTTLLEVAPSTAQATQIRTLPFTIVGLYTRPTWDDHVLAPTDVVDRVELNRTNANLLAGDTVQLEARAWPWTVTDSSVTWTSSNPEIAEVSSSGMVRANALGTATITAASTLTPGATATCTVEVIEINQTFNGLIWDGNGDIWWSEMKTDSLPTYTKLAQAETAQQLVSAAFGVDGTLYSASLDPNTLASQLYVVDPDTFQATPVGEPSADGYMDLAYAPHLGTAGALLAVHGAYILVVDTTTGQYTSAYAWSQSTNLVGIAYAGSQYSSQQNGYFDLFWLIDQEGNLYQEALIQLDKQIGYAYGPEDGWRDNLGTSSDTGWFNSLYYDGEYVFWSRYSKASNNVELLAWNGENNTYSLGYFGRDVWPVAGLFQLGSNPVAPKQILDLTEPSGILEEADGLELLQTSVQTPETATPELSLEVPDPMPRSDTGSSGKMIRLALPASQDTTNGRMTISYDASKLAFVDMASSTEASAYQAGEGRLEFAYAAKQPVPKGKSLALLNFQVLDASYEDSGIQTHLTECNETNTDHSDSILLDCPSKQFTDLNLSRWYHAYIDYVVTSGLMKGMSSTEFGSDLNTSRAMLVTTLYRLAGEPEVTEPATFTDVAQGRYYTNAIAWAEKNGIAKGVGGQKFTPNALLTREQTATFLYRYVTEYLKEEPVKGADLSRYTDAGRISQYAKKAVAWATAVGLLEGYGDGTVGPQNTTTRAQMAKFLTILDKKF